MDRTTVLRSMTHPYPLHGVAFALTGVPTLDLPAELNPRDPRNWPFFGSVVDYVESLRERSGQTPRRSVPANIALPFKFSSRRTGEVPRSGPYATFLGAEFDPVWTDYVGTATKGLAKTLADKPFDENDPYIGLSPDSYFYVPAATNLQADVTFDRLNRRKSLVAQLDEARRDLSASPRGRQLDRYRQMTYELLESDKLRAALDLRKEPTAMRELYGHTLFGQSCLAARRLVEAGSRIVSVFWDEYGLAGSGWDTHYNHYARMKQELVPRARPGLVRTDHRSGPARHAGRHAGRVHERARSDAQNHSRARVAAAIIGRASTRRSWPAAARNAGTLSAPRTSTAATSPSGRSAPRICWPRCTTCWESTTR